MIGPLKLRNCAILGGRLFTSFGQHRPENPLWRLAFSVAVHFANSVPV
jgi:hypothetical protein